MKRYIINYHTGAGNLEVETDDIQHVKEVAKNGITYTQENVTIEDVEGNVLFVSRWYGIHPEEYDRPLAIFGNGFYEEWIEF